MSSNFDYDVVFSGLEIMSESLHNKYVSPLKRPAVEDRAAPESSFLLALSSTSKSSRDNYDNRHDEKWSLRSSTRTAKNSNGWMSRITKDDVLMNANARQVERAQMASANRYKQFSIGGRVVTTNPLVSPLGTSPIPPSTKRVRVKTFGTILRPSPLCTRFWLVEFDNEKRFYCSEKVISFVDDIDSSRIVSKDAENKTTYKSLELSNEDKDAILFSILASKATLSHGHTMLTIEDLVTVFAQRYPWITAPKLKHHLRKMRSDTNSSDILHDDTLSLQDGEVEKDVTTTAMVTPGELHCCLTL